MTSSSNRKISCSCLALIMLGACSCKRGETRPSGSPNKIESIENSASPEAGTNGVTQATLDASECLLVEDEWGPTGTVAVRAEVVASGLDVPWGVLFLGDNDYLVTEREGRLRWIDDGKLDPRPLAEVNVSAKGEGGLLDIEAHPDFKNNGLFFLYATTSSGNRVETWRLKRGPGRPAVSRQGVLLDGIPSARFHNGGRMRIGPDGMLYIGTGDAREPELAQDESSLAGKLLRIAPDGSVPPDNPFGPDNPVYLMGIRNTQGWGWPSSTSLYVTDHGPSGELGRSDHDEVSVAAAGANLGWPTIYRCEENAGMTTPILTWGEAAPPGGAAIYTGSAIPQWSGSLLVGMLGARHLHRVVIDEETGSLEAHEVYFQGDPPEGLGRIRDVTMGPDGHLYVTTSNCDGRGSCPPDGDKLLRIVAR